jgi:hypothetical protein
MLFLMCVISLALAGLVGYLGVRLRRERERADFYGTIAHRLSVESVRRWKEEQARIDANIRQTWNKKVN